MENHYAYNRIKNETGSLIVLDIKDTVCYMSIDCVINRTYGF